VVAAASPAGLMKPVNLAAQLAAAETELACLKMALAQVKEDREELRQDRDDWRREAAKLNAEKLIAEKLREADEQLLAPPERRPWW
jgi:septal ring factor EnvC (AmiA/AmiB activator)